MSAVKVGATWGWESSWVMKLLGCSSKYFWQKFVLGHLVSFSQESKQMSPKWEKYMKSLFFRERWTLGYFCSKSWQKLQKKSDFDFQQSCWAAQSDHVFLNKPLPKLSSSKLPWFATWRHTLCLCWRGWQCVSCLASSTSNVVLCYLSCVGCVSAGCALYPLRTPSRQNLHIAIECIN